MNDHELPAECAAGASVLMLDPAPAARRGQAQSLPERSHLAPMVDKQLAACRRRGSALAVLSIALEGLDVVFERYGAAVEERLLEAAWHRLKSRLRGTDSVVRIGADGFGVILAEAKAQVGAAVEMRLVEALSAPYCIDTLVLDLDARTGLAAYPEAGATGEALVQAAREARLGEGETWPPAVLRGGLY